MSKIKILARSIAFFAAIQSVAVKGEYYVVQSGDVLTTIANKKISQSNLPINLEQVMLTIYKLNPEVFVDGDVDRVLPGKRIYIPDNVADFVQLSRNEALRHLRDKNYLRSLYSSSKLKLMNAPGQKANSTTVMQGYGQILQTLENHQQNIDILKIENAHLSKSFKLLERALGRIVVVQGLLTNDVVKVKSKLFNSSTNVDSSIASENNVTNLDSSALTDAAAVSLPKLDENLAKTELKESQPMAGVSSAQVSDQSGLSAASQTLEPATVNSAAVSNFTEVMQPKPIEKASASALSKQTKTIENSDGLWQDIAMIAAVLVPLIALLLWIVDFRKIRTKFMPNKAPIDIKAVQRFPIKDRLMPNAEANRYAVDIPTIDDLNHDVAPVKLKADKFEKVAVNKGPTVDRRAELGGIMELLDMCLLFGDYQQAHTITLKAISEYQTSPVLSKKLALIERKLAKY